MPNAELETPRSLASLVEVQSESVVSQTLRSSKAGTVTIFAFAAGEGLSEHTAPFDALILSVEGRATITVGGAPHVLETGDILRLPADIPHAVHAESPFKMLLIMLKAT